MTAGVALHQGSSFGEKAPGVRKVGWQRVRKNTDAVISAVRHGDGNMADVC